MFICWEALLFAAAIALAGRWGRSAEERLLLIVSLELTLESSLAALFSFSRHNSRAGYWIAAALILAVSLALPTGRRALRCIPRTLARLHLLRARCALPVLAALLAPLVLLSFHPVDEIDSINYLHYLIEWMANRTTPYDFATYYVAFWELSFLPSWVVTGVDLFFPLLAIKSLLLMALASWCLGREFRLRAPLLAAVVLGSCLFRHLWYAAAGVSTLKNDTLAGAGFLLLALVSVRAARRRLGRSDVALFAFGVVFASVKYLGLFVVPIGLVAVLWFARRQIRALPGPALRASAAIALLAMGTSWHYYVYHFIRWGSPFYPVQINLGPIHLPGLADLSDTSILYNLRNPELWRLFFLPASGISVAGLLFPLILAGILMVGAARCLRALFLWVSRRISPAPLDIAAILTLCGWLLYFRSAFGAGGSAGDLRFLRGDLNSLRYAIGPLASGELILAALFPRIAPFWVGINLVSRLVLLYVHIPSAVFSLWMVLSAVLIAAILALRPVFLLAALLITCPVLVERNRVLWTPYWNDIKPALASARPRGLAVLALTDGGYFAGQVVAAGNPVDPSVRALLPEQMDALAPEQRPPFLAILFSPGSDGEATWRDRYSNQWGYHPVAQGRYSMLLAR